MRGLPSSTFWPQLGLTCSLGRESVTRPSVLSYSVLQHQANVKWWWKMHKSCCCCNTIHHPRTSFETASRVRILIDRGRGLMPHTSPTVITWRNDEGFWNAIKPVRIIDSLLHWLICSCLYVSPFIGSLFLDSWCYRMKQQDKYVGSRQHNHQHIDLCCRCESYQGRMTDPVMSHCIPWYRTATADTHMPVTRFSSLRLRPTHLPQRGLRSYGKAERKTSNHFHVSSLLNTLFIKDVVDMTFYPFTRRASIPLFPPRREAELPSHEGILSWQADGPSTCHLALPWLFISSDPVRQHRHLNSARVEHQSFFQ